MFSDLYITTIPYVVALVSLVGVFFVFTKPRYAFYIMIFTFPMKNFYIWIGTSFEPWKILSIVFLIYAPTSLIKKSNIPSKKFVLLFCAFISYVFFTTLLNYILSPESSNMEGGFFKNEGRILSQIIFFILTINLAFIPMYVLKTEQDTFKTLQILLYSSIFLSIFGVIQYIVVNITGNNPFPIQGSDGISHSGYIMDSVFRINSLAGEPKHMAMSMVIGIAIIVISKINKLHIIKYELAVLLLFIFNLFFTYSTTGYVWTALVFAFVLFTGNKKSIPFYILLFVILFSAVIALLSSSETSQSTFIRQIERANFEIQDESVKSYFNDEPMHALIGTGLGNIHLYAANYIPSEFPLFRDTPYKANSGIFFMMGDYGLIGIFILYGTIFYLFIKNFNIIKIIKYTKYKKYNSSIVITYLSVIISILCLSRYNELFFTCFGVMLFVYNKLKEELNRLIRYYTA